MDHALAFPAFFTALLILLVLAPSRRRINRNPRPTHARPAAPPAPPWAHPKENPVFKFNLKQQVAITTSNEQGEIIGRAEYTHAEPSYYLRYRTADGRATEQWWPEGALTAEPANATA